MYAVMRNLFTPDHQCITEFLSLDSKDRVYWTRFGPHITSFNDEAMAQQWVDKLNAMYDCEVCDVGYGPEFCDA